MSVPKDSLSFLSPCWEYAPGPQIWLTQPSPQKSKVSLSQKTDNRRDKQPWRALSLTLLKNRTHEEQQEVLKSCCIKHILYSITKFNPRNYSHFKNGEIEVQYPIPKSRINSVTLNLKYLNVRYCFSYVSVVVTNTIAQSIYCILQTPGRSPSLREFRQELRQKQRQKPWQEVFTAFLLLSFSATFLTAQAHLPRGLQWAGPPTSIRK